MSGSNPKYGTPFVKKVYQPNPDDILRRILEKNPGARMDDTWLIFLAEVLKDRDMLEAVVRCYHINAYSRLDREARYRLDHLVPRAAPTKEERRARAADTWARMKKVLILNHVMPNGLRLRDCTFRYASAVGGAYTRIGEMGPPDAIIGRVLSNEQADAMVGEIGPDQIDRELNGAAGRQDHRAPTFLRGAALEAPR
jgi:hypothetical protein